MRYYLLDDLETNKPKLEDMKTFYRSFRKQKSKLFNQRNYEQFAQFDDDKRFHDDVVDELFDGGYELELFNKNANKADEDLVDE